MRHEQVTIGLIEPSQMLCEGLTNFLLRSNNAFQVYQFENLEELMNSHLKDLIDLIILNPGYIQGSLKHFQSMRKSLPSIRWIALIYAYYDKEVLSQFSESLLVTDTLAEVFNKLNKFKEIPEQYSTPNEKEQLSERETDVLRCLVNGLPNKEIADKLNISIHTVISHRKNISQKTGIKSQAGLTIYALSQNIIHLEGNIS